MNHLANERLLLCNVAYMEQYDSFIMCEQPKNGGAHITTHGTGGEINNFHVYEDNKCYGYVEPGRDIEKTLSKSGGAR